ncbi:MAG: hypothetical protein M0R74_09960 [Dehalococcoidia bacterium]|nr:hypothetical protein [Dehalococcoidia bacterium]
MTNSWVFRIGVAIVAIAVLGGIAAGIARGFDNDRTVEYRVVDRSGQALNQDEGVVVIEADRGFPRGAFFPVFPLVFLGGALIVGSIIATRGRGPGSPSQFEAWHEQAHRER